jgi:hypothetical protein
MPVGHKFTVLRLVQRVLSRLGLHNISTLGDSEEDVQVLELLNSQYEELVADFPWAHRQEFFNLEVTATDHIMRLPDDVLSFEWIKYDGKYVQYVTPERMDSMLNRDTTPANVDANGAFNDRDPQYWTSINDREIIFNSYDSSLVSADTTVFGRTMPNAFFTSDAEELDLPPVLNTLLEYMMLEWGAEEINGDTTAAQSYGRRVRRLRQSAKRWARRHNRKETAWGPDYARRGHMRFRRTIDSSRIVEGS